MTSYFFGPATTEVFHSFDPEEAEPLIESIQIWRWYDACELLLFVDQYVLLLLLLVGASLVAAELVRMVREWRNPASPYKLYAAPLPSSESTRRRSAKKSE